MEVTGAVLAELAAERGATLRPVTVSLYQHEADATALRHMTGVDGDAPDSPADSIEQAGRCRVVVAGSYHSAVFALGQGVPVVALSATPYYDHKLEGLADLFPGGCTVLPAGERELPERLAAAVREAWDAAQELRPALLASAEGQIAEARDAYERFAAEAGRRTGLQPAGTLSVTEETSSSESESLYL
jgi:hypothetical protein